MSAAHHPQPMAGDPAGAQPLLDAVHAAVVNHGAPADALHRVVWLVERFLAHSGALLYGFPTGTAMTLWGGSLQDAFDQPMGRQEDDPCLANAARRRGATLVHATRTLPRRQFENSTAYRHFYGPRACEHVVCLRVNGLDHGQPGMVGLFLGRGAEDGDFDGASKVQLLAVLPVLGALWRADQCTQDVGALLDGLHCAVADRRPLLVYSHNGALVWRSPSARTLLDHLGSARAGWVCQDGGERLAVKLAAGPLRTGTLLAAADAAMEVVGPYVRNGEQFVVVALRCGRDPEATLAQRHGLTAAEAAVLSCLGQGMSNTDLGAYLQISAATAATHVKRVLKKLGVRSRLQAGLMMQRLQLMDDLGLESWE